MYTSISCKPLSKVHFLRSHFVVQVSIFGSNNFTTLQLTLLFLSLCFERLVPFFYNSWLVNQKSLLTYILTKCSFSSVQFSRSVVSNSLRPHESQHARPPCPSRTPSSLKLMSIESVMPSSHLILCHFILNHKLSLSNSIYFTTFVRNPCNLIYLL